MSRNDSFGEGRSASGGVDDGDQLIVQEGENESAKMKRRRVQSDERAWMTIGVETTGKKMSHAQYDNKFKCKVKLEKNEDEGEPQQLQREIVESMSRRQESWKGYTRVVSGSCCNVDGKMLFAIKSKPMIGIWSGERHELR
jgi:hypothetical protein